MVIYNSGDSELLIQTLTDNLKSSKEIFDKINRGTQHLNSVIDSGTLSGAAYRAGQSLFQTYIAPMIQRLDSAISDIQSDLDSYKKSEQKVRTLSSHLDEALLSQKLENTNRLIQLVEQKMEEDKKVIQKFMSSGFEGVATGLAELPGLDGQLNNLKELKHDYEKKLKALREFSSSTSSLFTDSLQAFKYALQGVDIINQSRASVDGTISFPSGMNMDWSTKLQGVPFNSELQKKEKNGKKGSVDTQQFVSDMQDIQGFFNNPSKNLFDWANFSDILNKYYSMLPGWLRKMNENGVHYDENLKKTGKADLYKVVGNWGTFEIGKASEKTSLINGSKSFKKGSKGQYRTPNSKGISAGPTVGGTYSLLNWTAPTTWGWSPTVDLVNAKGNSHFNVSKDGFDVGGDALVSAASGGLSFNLNIPGTEWKATFGASGYLGGLGASGHATAEPKEGSFSFGASGSIGIGGGFNFGISKK